MLTLNQYMANHHAQVAADAITAALKEQGMKIVGREPTEGAFCAGDEVIVEELNKLTFALNGGDTPAQKCWRAMFDATTPS